MQQHQQAQSQGFTGADAVVEALEHQGVEVIFGMVGGAIMPVYDALYRRGSIHHIVVGHEQGAGHMADGYARASGKVGVAMATSGPGATNLVTAIATAFMDSSPVVAFTGQVTSSLLGVDAFQEADMRGITMPITKHNYQVTDPAELPATLAEAFYVALSGRPGPVLIDLPRDVTTAPCSPSLCAPPLPLGYRPPYRPHPLQVERALKVLARARRPVILAGGGVVHAGAHEELRMLAEALEAPVATTLMGLGVFPAGHRLHLGMPGMHGTPWANLALHHADVLVIVGSRLDDRVTGKVEHFAPEAKVIHIDVDASEIGKILDAHVPVEADARPALRALAEGVKAWEKRPDLSAWHEQIAEWRRRYPMTYPERDGLIAPQRVVEELGAVLDEEDIVATGVGQHQMFVAQYYPFRRPRKLITSGGLGTMGFGLPAAIGAAVATKGSARVVCIDGDGSMLMNIQELATAVRYKVGVVVIVMNNSLLGMVAQWQRMFYEGRLSASTLSPPRFDRLAQAFGAAGRRVSRPEELVEGLRWALATAEEQGGPVVLEVVVDPEAEVLPMVPPGAANAQFIPCKE